MMKPLTIRIILLFTALIGMPQHAAEKSKATDVPRIQVNAILNNAAVLTVGGKQQMVIKNSHTREGYKLTQIGIDHVTLLISGKSIQFSLGAAITSSKSALAGKHKITIHRDQKGMFSTAGEINHYPVTFLIDTGATMVAFNSTLAEKMGIDYLATGIPIIANTASGTVTAYEITLNNVSIDNLRLYLVKAVVIEGDFPIVPLLGMSFLHRVKMTNDGGILTIEEKI